MGFVLSKFSNDCARCGEEMPHRNVYLCDSCLGDDAKKRMARNARQKELRQQKKVVLVEAFGG